MVGPAWSLWPLVLVIVIFGLTNQVQSQHAFVVSPNTFRLGAAETVVVYSHSGVQDVTVSLADYPAKKKTFFSRNLKVKHDEPQKLEITVKPEHISDLNITGALDHHYVFLMVNSGGKPKDYKVLVTLHSGYLFIQTDKPIYTPKQQVNIRLIRLNEDMLVDNETFTLQIRNPQNTIVDSRPSTGLKSQNGMYNYAFKFPGYSLLGEWSVTVLYGLKIKLNSTVTFELREYVLPTFQVKVEAPDVIFSDSEKVEILAKAKYVYGKNVQGKATFRLKVKLATGHTEHFGNCEGRELFEGEASCVISTEDIKNKTKIGWFPGINGARLLVEAIVFEHSSGAKENGTSEVTMFSTAPYIISFQKSLSDFRPGIDAVVQAQITHVHGKPATDVSVKIRVMDNNNKIVPVKTSSGTSNEDGLVAFAFETNTAHNSLKVTIETDDRRHPSKGTHTMFPYKSTVNGAYVGISKDNTLVHKVGETFTRSIFTFPKDMQTPISYLVVSKGRILATGSNWPDKSVQRSLSFKVTADMVPSARVLIFAVYANNILTDSLKFTVEKVCQPSGLITLEAESDRKPGGTVHLKVKGKPNTMVGILAVDQAVYALRNKDKLTSDKMFREMDKHDLGCGAGGGMDSAAVLTNAGVIIIADVVSLTNERKSCLERKLKKRAISEEITRQHGQANKQCCELGKVSDRFKRTCEDRAEIIRRFEGTDLEDKAGCASVYLKCCKELQDAVKPREPENYASRPFFGGGPGRSQNEKTDELDDFLDDEALALLEGEIRERKDFRETWLWDSGVIGPTGILEQTRGLPDSITTWIIQAVGLSGKGGGMCVAEPKKVVAFQDIFMDVKMPYNVVKNEQIEIPVTVFNYGSKRLMMLVYTYGVEGLCSEAEPKQKGTPKKIYVNANSAETVAFQMIPLEAKDFSLTFSAMSSSGSDTVTKTLSVIPEGVLHEEFFPFAIDPSNTEKRKRRNIVSEKYEARFDTENKKQLSIVKLHPEMEFVVPGTEYAVVEGIGDKFGTTIETSLNNPDGLLRLPRGCGEQNMAYMAPTVYAFHYLKATGKVTPQQETNAYKYIREGYNKQLTYRNAADGAFSVWPKHHASTWLTAFVARVFCQSGKYVFIDDNVVCGALNWLVSRQNPDGTFVEKYMVHHKEMKGGVNGDVPLTAFVLMSFQQCQCNNANLQPPREKAVNYLRGKVAEINDHYRMAITAYALALYDTEMAIEANEKLLQMSSYDPAANARYWGDGKSAISVEASSYALLTQILYSDVEKATSIVNWLNGQRRIGGSFWSTQDTVIAIEALAEYAILAREPDISLVMNISSTSDPNFKHTWQFKPDNARVKRQIELSKIGGKLIVEAQGSGTGLFGVRMRYNIANSPDSICKFDISVGVSEAIKKINQGRIAKAEEDFDFSGVPAKLVQDLGVVPNSKSAKKNESQPHGRSKVSRPQVFASRQNNRFSKPLSNVDLGFDYDELRDDQLDEPPKLIWKRDLNIVINPPVERGLGALKSTQLVLNITICARYLGNGATNMAIVDVGMLTGYEANEDDLKNLVRDNSQTIDRFEKNGRNLIFYLEKISSNEQTCFAFRIHRKFLASNLESGLVRVYDYYEPNQACSQFYRPKTVGPALGKVCFEEKLAPGDEVVNRVCKCAEGGCPPEEPFKSIFGAENLLLARKMLADLACNIKDYFWRVKVASHKEERSGYTHYKMKVIKVIKEGREKQEEVEDDEREFLARGNCPTSVLSQGTIYYIMGRDPEPREVDGGLKYTYFIDKTTLIRPWIDVSNKSARKINRSEKRRQSDIFSNIERKFEDQQACND